MIPGTTEARPGVTDGGDLRGEPDVTESDQLTVEVRRDCDLEYLRRASEFIRAAAARDVLFSCPSTTR